MRVPFGKDVKLASSHIHQLQEHPRLPSRVSDHVEKNNTLPQPHRNSVKRIVMQQQYPRMELGRRTTKMKIVAIQQKVMKRKRIQFHCSAWIYTVAYNTWLDSTAATRYSKRSHKVLGAQWLCIVYVYGQAHAPTAHQHCNNYILPEADDAEETVWAHGCNDVDLYQPSTLRAERGDELLS